MCPLDYLAHGPLRDFCSDHFPSPSTQEGQRHAEYRNGLKPSTGSKHPLCKGLDSSPPFPKLHLFWEQGRKERQKLVRLRLGKRTVSFRRALPGRALCPKAPPRTTRHSARTPNSTPCTVPSPCKVWLRKSWRMPNGLDSSVNPASE